MKNFFTWFRELLQVESVEMVNLRRLVRFSLFLLTVFSFILGITFLFLMRGSREVQLPNVTQLDLIEAMKRLQGLKLRYYVTQSWSREEPRYTVISQKPDPGTIVKAGRIIVLKVSLGPKVNRMPDFLGRNFDDAQSELAGLFTAYDKAPRVVKQVKFSTNIPDGCIIEQYPQSGEKFDPNADIVFLVSRGVRTNELASGDWRLQNYKETAAFLESMGIDVRFRMKAAADKKNIGRILSQSVPAGVQLKDGDSIEFIVGVDKDSAVDQETSEIWRILSILVPRRPATYKPPEGFKPPREKNLRLVEVRVNDSLGSDIRLREKVMGDSYYDLPYRTLGKGFVEVFIDGEKYTTLAFP